MSIASGLSLHLSRIGGVIVRPRETFARIIEDGQGSALELVPWMIIVTSAMTPRSVGHAVLLLRARFLDGMIDFSTIIAARLSYALFGVVAGAVALAVLERLRGEGKRMGFDRAIDACTFMLVPFLLLSVVGFFLAGVGIDLWWLPHNKMVGPPPIAAIRIFAAFGWSLVLFGLVARSVWNR